MTVTYANYYQNVTSAAFDEIKGLTFNKRNRIIEDGNDDLDYPELISRVSESIELTLECRELASFTDVETLYMAGNTNVVVFSIYDAQAAVTAVMTITSMILMNAAIENNWSNLFMMRYVFRCDTWSVTGVVS